MINFFIYLPPKDLLLGFLFSYRSLLYFNGLMVTIPCNSNFHFV